MIHLRLLLLWVAPERIRCEGSVAEKATDQRGWIANASATEARTSEAAGAEIRIPRAGAGHNAISTRASFLLSVALLSVALLPVALLPVALLPVALPPV